MMRADPGFTLLEVLVAFAIAALALGTLFRGTIDGLHTAQIASRYQEAVTRAESRLAALSAGNLTAGDRQGDDGNGFHWHERITPVETAAPAGLYTVNVAISWVEDRKSVV